MSAANLRGSAKIDNEAIFSRVAHFDGKFAGNRVRFRHEKKKGERPESLLERCADKIEKKAPSKQRPDLLVISEVMAGLRYPDMDLVGFFGGQQAMLESPVLKKWRAEVHHMNILDILKDRFGVTPRDVTKPLRDIINEKRLRRLHLLATKCRDLDAFREALLS